MDRDNESRTEWRAHLGGGYMAPTTVGTQQEMQSPPGYIGKLL